jgi:hypothetical protein
MSVAVALAELPETAASFGDAAFVLTVGDDERPKVAHVRVRVEDGIIELRAGRGTVANAQRRPLVVVLWPAVEPGGFSLIVDAECEPRDAGDEGPLRCRPTSAVLHRPALDA